MLNLKVLKPFLIDLLHVPVHGDTNCPYIIWFTEQFRVFVFPTAQSPRIEGGLIEGLKFCTLLLKYVVSRIVGLFQWERRVKTSCQDLPVPLTNTGIWISPSGSTAIPRGKVTRQVSRIAGGLWTLAMGVSGLVKKLTDCTVFLSHFLRIM